MKRSLLLFVLLVGWRTLAHGADSDPKLFPVEVNGSNQMKPDSEKSGFIDSSGKIVIALTAEYRVLQPAAFPSCFVEGLQPVTVGLKTKWPANSSGYLNRSGKFAIEPRFMNAEPFSEGLAAASAGTGPPWGYGYIDHSGKWVIQPQFENAGPFSEGLAQVTTSDTHLTGFIDPKGNWVVKPELPAWSSYSNFSEGLACVPEKRTTANEGHEPTNYAWKFIDKTGAPAINRTFADPSVFHEGLAAVKDGDTYGYIDKTGTFAFPARFLEAGGFSEGLARVQMKDGRRAYIDRQGAVAFETPGIEWAQPFSDGMAAVETRAPDGQSPNGFFHGFIDRTGKLVIAMKFLGTSPFRDGLAQAVDKDNFGYIDKTGAFVWRTNAPKLPDWGD